MMLPPYLQKGDTVAIAASARKVSPAEMQPAISLFESWGLKVQLPSDLFAVDHQFAGNDQLRAHTFQQLLNDPTIKAIFCARGGYGTVRMIDALDFTHFIQHPKWIIGYSDITVLHSHLFRHTSIATIHATMPINMQAHTADAESIESLRTLLFGSPIPYTFNPHPFNTNGKTTGKLVGGNLSVLYSLLGSESDIDTQGCILFLEDLDEYLYHIDRMMVNLKRNGKLAKLAGLVVGDMSDMKDNTIPFGKTALEIIAEHTAAYEFPVAFGFPAGHEKRNLAMTFGIDYTLESAHTSCNLFQS
jgi:muramoyltetrapeptide carboxypeptidase